jgi:hypothetical protein
MGCRMCMLKVMVTKEASNGGKRVSFGRDEWDLVGVAKDVAIFDSSRSSPTPLLAYRVHELGTSFGLAIIMLAVRGDYTTLIRTCWYHACSYTNRLLIPQLDQPIPTRGNDF